MQIVFCDHGGVIFPFIAIGIARKNHRYAEEINEAFSNTAPPAFP